MECEGGPDPASPTPTPIRASAMVVKFVAAPLIAVNTDQTTAEAAMIRTRFERSA